MAVDVAMMLVGVVPLGLQMATSLCRQRKTALAPWPIVPGWKQLTAVELEKIPNVDWHNDNAALPASDPEKVSRAAQAGGN